MKKYTDIILGIATGIIVFISLVFVSGFGGVAIGADDDDDSGLGDLMTNTGTRNSNAGVFSQMLNEAGIDNPHYRISFDDVFGSATYENLYLLLFQYALVEPEDSALAQVAQKYGMTANEAAAVRDGALTPILKNPKFSLKYKTQKDIQAAADALRADFDQAYELYNLENELALGSGMSEVFSNGDVLDSGFDLVTDLSIMEELLFAENTSSSIAGAPLKLDFSSKDTKSKNSDSIPNETASPSSPVYSVLEETSASFDAVVEYEDGTQVVSGEVLSGENEESPAAKFEILDADPCPDSKTDSEFQKALDAIDTNEALEPDTSEPSPNTTPVVDTGINSGTDSETTKSFVEKLNPKTPPAWLKQMNCDQFLWEKAYGSAESSAGSSDGKITTSSAQYYICLDINLIWETYTTYFADGEKCVSCEIEKALSYLDKTLSSSLVPNKVTGNYMESSKCKSAFDLAPFVDMHFYTVLSPMILPQQDDAIYGKNLIKEWNKFFEKSNPFALDNVGASLTIDFTAKLAENLANQNASPDQTLAENLRDIEQIENSFMLEQSNQAEKYNVVSQGEDLVAYSQAVIAEIGQMTNFFKNFLDMYTTIANESCPVLLAKPYVD